MSGRAERGTGKQSASRVAFDTRLEPGDEQAEDLDTERLVTRAQGGDKDAFATLYTRYFDRVYGYLRVAFKDFHEAEDAAQQVFVQVLEALPRYEHRGRPFRAWLFVIARNYAIKQLQKQGRIDVIDPATLDRHREGAGEDEEGLRALEWISDSDLAIFAQRLPAAQRQVLALNFMFGLTSAEIAKLLGRTPGDVRKMQSRALAFLRKRLNAVGRDTPGVRRDRALVRAPKQATVLRSRRFSLSEKRPTRW